MHGSPSPLLILGIAPGHPSPCTVPAPLIPAGCNSVGGHNDESTDVVPAEAHGEEQEVAGVTVIPAWSSPWRGQHKPDLVTDEKEVRL